MGLGDPRVIWSLVDLSAYVDEIQKGWQIVLVQTERGPMWDPTAISDEESFIRIFGNCVDWTTDPLWCLKALGNGAKLIVVRIGRCTDVADRSTLTVLPAECNIPDRGATSLPGEVISGAGPFTFSQAVPGSVTGDEVGPFLITLDTNDTLQITVGSGLVQTVTLTAGAQVDAADIVDEINAQTTGLTASVSDNDTVVITANDDADSITISTVTHDAATTLGISLGVYAASAGTQTLVISADRAADQTITLEPVGSETGDFILSTAQVVAQLANITGATASVYNTSCVKVASNTVGSTSYMQVKSSSTADAPMGFSNTEDAGWEGTAISAWKCTLTGPGAYGNGAKLYIYDNKLKPGERMDLRLIVPGGPDVIYPSLSNDETDPRYWFSYFNEHCSVAEITNLVTPNPSPNNWPAINASGITLSGGSNGTTTLQDVDYVGDAAAKTGLYATHGALIPAIDIWCPGTTSAVVHTAALEFVDNTSGRFYQGATPPDMDVNDTVDYRMGNPPNYEHAAFDTANGALIYGEYKVLDTKFNQKVYLPASYQLCAAVSRCDEEYGTAISPFGMKRGRCSGVHGIKNNIVPASADADTLAEYGINSARLIHTSVETRGWEGAVLWGGWTLQRTASALREYPVVRKIKEYEHMLLPVMLGFINDPNHPVVWGEIHRTLEPVFRRDLERYHIYGYFLQTDKDAFFAGGDLKGAVLNTPADIDQGKYRMRILIKPLRQIFYFCAEMGVMRTGDPFTDYSTLYALPGWVRK